MHLNSLIKKYIQNLGIDKSIAYSSGARVIQAFTGVASIFFIAQYLTKTEQGFYYTFGSIVAIQVFFELGLTNIITQYVAHEASHLTWKDSINLEGNKQNHSRLAHLLRFSVKWYSITSLIFLLVLLAAGYWFFNDYSPVEENISWQLPWVLISFGTVINLFLSPLLAILMGLDKVKDVMKMRFYQQLIIPASTWIGLAIGFHLYVVGIASLLSALYVVIYCFSTNLRKILTSLWKMPITDKVGYMNEIFPFQWKIALSWLSGYFIYQLFNPVLFATEGAAVAGQMGMTLAAINGISAFSQSWINTKVPLWSKLIALKKYDQLDKTFNSTIKQVSVVCLGLIGIMLSGIWVLRLFENPLGNRFLPWLPLIFMLLPLYINQWIFSMASYIRCHKREPFVWNAITIAILSTLSTLCLGKYFGVNGITIGYSVITFISLIWVYAIFKSKKESWHER